MSSLLTVPVRVHAPGYLATITTDPVAVRAAQRLRHEVFRGAPGVDADRFDDRCDHLIVTEQAGGAVVGTYRLLPPDRGAPPAELYSDAEFNLAPLAGLRSELVEAGRSCVHPDHRGGAVINLMWATLARYMRRGGHRWLAGCASVPLAGAATRAALSWRLARDRHLAPAPLRVTPRRPWPVPPAEFPGRPTYAVLPPLLRGYLRLGAWVCGPPAHDPDFGVADLFVLLDLERVDQRYLRHFLGDGQ